MGTRNLTCVALNGEIKVAQYGQWDGYPEGQGSTICDFLETVDLPAFKQAVAECRFITAEEYEASVADIMKGNRATLEEFIDMDTAGKIAAQFPQFNRNTGAKILDGITSGVRELQNEFDFGTDGLFCKWAYVLDLDRDTLEVYRGFNQGEAVGRWADLPVEKDSEYKPITLICEIPFKDATVEAILAHVPEDK